MKKKGVVRPGYVSQENKTTKVHVSELKLGMFVADLDRPWLETPFLMQGFRIEDIKDIDTIQEYCQHAWIEATEDTWIDPQQRGVLNPKRPLHPPRNKTSAAAEQDKAFGVYKEARRITKSLYEEVSLGGGIDTAQAKSTVNDCVQSVLRNADALMWMSRLREEDSYTAEHSLNVCILAVSFGKGLGFSEEDLQKIGLCGLLHDIGKMRVPQSILNKPGRLTDAEFAKMREHTTQGRNLLMSSDGLYHGVIDCAYSHHERVDGSGYPRQLKAASIPQYAKMIAIVDAYDAMTAERCYAPSKISTDALKELYSAKGTHFDERLALQFIKTVGLYPPGTIVELACGRIAIVVSTNYRYQHLPEIVVVLDKDKKPCAHETINLAGYVDKTIAKEYLVKKVHKAGSFGINISNYLEKGFRLG